MSTSHPPAVAAVTGLCAALVLALVVPLLATAPAADAQVGGRVHQHETSSPRPRPC